MTIRDSIRDLRRWLAKFIEPETPADPFWDIPIDVALRGAAELRPLLGVDEQMYMFVAGQAMGDGRSYVLYTALDEVEKTGMYVMRLREFLQGPVASPRDGRLERLLLTHLLEEQDARVRRLLELLVTLILFERTNEQPYYKHMLVLEQLERYAAANADLAEFYGQKSRNVEASLERQFSWAKDIEKTLDLTRAWYASDRKPLSWKEVRPGQVFSSVRHRIRAAIPLMTAQEKLLFGFTYGHQYGRTSSSIHYHPARQDFGLDSGDAKGRVFGLSMLIFAVLRRCHLLLGAPDLPFARRVVDILAQTSPDDLVHAATVRDLALGDFVLAYSYLCEVEEIQESPYGYRSYRVRYLAEKPTPDIHDDWYPALYVQRLYSRSAMLEAVKAKIATGELGEGLDASLERIPAEQLQEIVRQAMLSTWNAGLRASLLTRKGPKR